MINSIMKFCSENNLSFYIAGKMVEIAMEDPDYWFNASLKRLRDKAMGLDD